MLVRERKVRATRTALADASALGFDFGEMLCTVLDLKRSDFYKSMTSHFDHKVWQDVYHVRTIAGIVYLKLIVSEDVLLVSYKEL